MAHEGKKRRRHRTGPHCLACKVRSYEDGETPDGRTRYRCPMCGDRFKLVPGGGLEILGLLKGPWENLGPGC